MIDTTPEIDLSPERPWREDVNKMATMAKLLAHPGMMIDKMRTETRINQEGMRSMQRAAGKALHGEDYEPKTDDDPEGDDMGGVNIGNEIETHYHVTQAAQPTGGDPVKPTAPKSSSGLLPLAATALATALGVGGLAYGLTRPTTPPTTTSPSDRDAYPKISIEVHDQ